MKDQYETMHNRSTKVRSLIPNCRVWYSVDHALNERAILGKVVFLSDRDDFFCGPDSKPYRSKVVKNPSWLTVAKLANEAIETTGDYHHVFLEGVCAAGYERETNTLLYRFILGS